MFSNNQSVISVKTEVFEGPLELLLDLVEKRKLLINDISLASVTDEYMREISALPELSLPNATHFVALAATLLLVKSKSLLPILDLTAEEEQSIDDLESRLKYYQIIRDVALPLQLRFGKTILYTPQFTPPAISVFVPDQYCNLSSLQIAINDVMVGLPVQEKPRQATVKMTISLEEMMSRLESRIRQNLKTKFSELHLGEVEKKTVIVSFLALLELFKQGHLIVTQNERFAEIEIELEHQDTPRYY